MKTRLLTCVTAITWGLVAPELYRANASLYAQDPDSGGRTCFPTHGCVSNWSLERTPRYRPTRTEWCMPAPRWTSCATEGGPRCGS